MNFYFLLVSMKTPVWHVVSEVISELRQAVEAERPFSDVARRKLYTRIERDDGQHYVYTEIGIRFLMFTMPERFDSWGLDEFGGHWNYSFCIMDDFGNAVPADPFNHYEEGYKEVLVPDYSVRDQLEPGQPYPYIRMAETVH